jgi:hypothetical protein
LKQQTYGQYLGNKERKMGRVEAFACDFCKRILSGDIFKITGIIKGEEINLDSRDFGGEMILCKHCFAKSLGFEVVTKR